MKGTPHMTDDDSILPATLRGALAERNIVADDEVGLRRALEERVSGYSIYRLTPAAARRWKCRYRIMLDAGYFDGQNLVEAYARALLAVTRQAYLDVPGGEC